jgi:hypothetical protein
MNDLILIVTQPGIERDLVYDLAVLDQVHSKNPQVKCWIVLTRPASIYIAILDRLNRWGLPPNRRCLCQLIWGEARNYVIQTVSLIWITPEILPKVFP